MMKKLSVALALAMAAAVSMTAADAQWGGERYGGYQGAYGGVYGSPYGGAYDSAYSGAYDSAYRDGDWGRATAPGSYYSYGADRANPSTDPSGYDLDNARDRQLNGHN